MGYSSIEYYILCLLHYVPFIFLFIVLFRKKLRFSNRTTIAIVLLTTMLYMVANHYVEFLPQSTLQHFTYIESISLLFLAFLIVSAPAGQILFTLLILKNCADFIVVVSKYLEYKICPRNALMMYSWTYSVSTIICELLLYLTIRYFFKRKLDQYNMHRIDKMYWSYLWIVPLFFYLLWIYIFYASDISSLELATKNSTCLFMVLSMSCQLYIYFCLSLMVQNYQLTYQIKEELFASKAQAIQYDNISQQISQTRELRHNLRHHFILISSYLEEHEYDALEKYVHQEMSSYYHIGNVVFSKNKALNVVMAYYSSLCKSKKIEFISKLNIPTDFGLSDSEVTVLFGNLIENAYEACLKCNFKQRKITVLGRRIQSNYVFSISNTVPVGFILPDTNTFISSKNLEPGIGTESCKKIIYRHSGTIQWVQKKTVTVDFSLPC